MAASPFPKPPIRPDSAAEREALNIPYSSAELETLNVWKYDPRIGMSGFGKLKYGAKRGWRMGAMGGGLMNTAMIGLQMATAQRGEVIPTLTTGVVGIVTYGVISSMITAGLMLIPGINVGVATYLALGLAIPPEMKLEAKMMNGMKFLSGAGQQIRALHMGGGYNDTDNAIGRRREAIMEMSGASMPYRRYLGQEAKFLHR